MRSVVIVTPGQVILAGGVYVILLLVFLLLALVAIERIGPNTRPIDVLASLFFCLPFAVMVGRLMVRIKRRIYRT